MPHARSNRERILKVAKEVFTVQRLASHWISTVATKAFIIEQGLNPAQGIGIGKRPSILLPPSTRVEQCHSW